jgi:hypothetical protein
MVWFIELAVLGIPLLGSSLAVLVYYRAKVEDLWAVIRAQRTCMDNLETELLFPDRNRRRSTAPRRAPRGMMQQANSNPGSGPFFGRGAGHSIEPSTN